MPLAEGFSPRLGKSASTPIIANEHELVEEALSWLAPAHGDFRRIYRLHGIREQHA
jgi:hypothetical protein